MWMDFAFGSLMTAALSGSLVHVGRIGFTFFQIVLSIAEGPICILHGIMAHLEER